MDINTVGQQANDDTHTHTYTSIQLDRYPFSNEAGFNTVSESCYLPERKCFTFASFVSFFCFLLPRPLLQSFYSSLVKTPEPYGVIFSHPAHLYHPTHMQAFAPTPSNLTHTQLEPVDLSVSKRSSSSSNSSSSSPPCSTVSSPVSSHSSPPSPYSSASHASPRCSPPQSQLRSSPAHALSPPTPSIPYSTMVAPLISSGSGVIQSSGVMVSPVMVPLSVLYSSPLHLHQPLMVSPSVGHDDDHHRSREHRKGEGAFIVFFVFFMETIWVQGTHRIIPVKNFL